MKRALFVLAALSLLAACGTPSPVNAPAPIPNPGPGPAPAPMPTGSFTMTASNGGPIALTASAGSSTTTQAVTFTPKDGFDGPVSLSLVDGQDATAQPVPGLTVTANGAASLTLSGRDAQTPTLTVTVDHTVAQTGSSPRTVYLRASAGSTSQAVPIRLQVSGFTVDTTSDANSIGDVTRGDGLCVDTTGHCSLRAAAQEVSKLSPSSDTVITIPAGHYTFADADVGPIVMFSTGSGHITLKGAGASGTILDANQGSGVFANYSRSVTVDGLTLQNATGVPGSGSMINGSGIFNFATLTVKNAIVRGNRSPGGLGGGIDNTGTLTLSHVTISGNSASEGGGIYNNSGSTLTLDDSTLSDNHSIGGLALGGGIDNFGTLTLRGTTLSGNSGVYGGGLINYGVVTASNTTLSGNTATYGGGIANVGTLDLSFSTVAHNSADEGGGIEFYYQSTSTLKGALLSGNTSPHGPDCQGAFTSAGANLLRDATDCSGTTSSDRTDVDPRLGALGDHGGPTLTLLPATGSPAIDAVPGGACTDKAGTSLNTDQRGQVRPQGAACDVGAVEQ